MELRHLRYFQAVADTLHFRRAAERLHVTQPALSRQIRDLEIELGVKLFARSTVQVKLTEAGKHFLQEVSGLFEQLNAAVTTTRQIGEGVAGTFNIGSDWRMPLSLVPEAAGRFREIYPDVTINFVDLPIHEHIEALRAGRIHVGFVSALFLGAREDLELLHVSTAEMRLVVKSQHPLASRERVYLRELKKETWLRLEESYAPGYRAYLIQLCRLAQFTPKLGRRATSVAGMLAHVAAGDGICAVPESLILKQDGSLRYPVIECPPFVLNAVTLKDGPVFVSAFMEILRSQLGRSNEATDTSGAGKRLHRQRRAELIPVER